MGQEALLPKEGHRGQHQAGPGGLNRALCMAGAVNPAAEGMHCGQRQAGQERPESPQRGWGCAPTCTTLEIGDLVNIEMFLTAKEVEESLERRETATCLAWCHDNKSRLRKMKGRQNKHPEKTGRSSRAASGSPNGEGLGMETLKGEPDWYVTRDTPTQCPHSASPTVLPKEPAHASRWELLGRSVWTSEGG
ncbi:hypothetical protein P7K49_005824 [Saguinus oedipus]|uniref:CTLH domain-containing protein n=1 Tax=Saguinus oedipus TaxID=9490 RepID=A0ABQ9W0N7_SAGOE|nr:hypothetical protein P7K49_005824 [Saguinus oedipus]